MSGPIFGSSSTLGGSSGGNRHLVEFRAGRMNMVNRMVHPDNRKGLVYVYQAEDGLIHFCWKDRTTGTIKDDLILFPDDCEFKRLDYVKNGRVFVLKFKSSNRKLFYWMQEPKVDRDEEWCRRINEVINNPPSGSNIAPSGRNGGNDNGDLQYMLNNMSQQQIMQLFGGVGQMGGLSSLLGTLTRSGNSSSRTNTTTPSSRSNANVSGSKTTATPATAALNSPSIPRAPKKTNGSVKTNTTAASSGSPSGTPISRTIGINTAGIAGAGQQRSIDLASVVNTETLASIIADQEKVDALVTHLPQLEGDDNKQEQLKETISSPQFHQALSMFSNALQSGQLGPVVSQFQLNAEAVAAATAGDLQQFVKALENNDASKPECAASSSYRQATAAPAGEQKKTPEASKEDDGHKGNNKDKDEEMTG